MSCEHLFLNKIHNQIIIISIFTLEQERKIPNLDRQSLETHCDQVWSSLQPLLAVQNKMSALIIKEIKDKSTTLRWK